MNEHEIEQLLRRYRPSGPPPNLRARALAAARDEKRVWPWAAAAAALLAATIGFHMGSHSLQMNMAIAAGPEEEEVSRQMLIEALGGDEAARQRADLMIAAQVVRSLGSPPEEGVLPGGLR
jgi:hypothetical protein